MQQEQQLKIPQAHTGKHITRKMRNRSLIRSSSVFSIPNCPMAFCPSSSRSNGFAPPLTSILIKSLWPYSAALWSGVWPLSSLLWGHTQMMSIFGGGGGSQKADVEREVAWIHSCILLTNADRCVKSSEIFADII